MSLPATDRLTRSLDHLREQMLRLARDAEAAAAVEPGGYPRALGGLIGCVRARLDLMDHILDAATSAAQDVWNPCTHDTRCPWCEEAAEQRAQEVAR